MIEHKSKITVPVTVIGLLVIVLIATELDLAQLEISEAEQAVMEDDGEVVGLRYHDVTLWLGLPAQAFAAVAAFFFTGW